MAKKPIEVPIPKKRDPGDRARQPLSVEEAKKIVDFAARAAELKKNTERGQKKEAFIPLQEASGMTRESLLRWAHLYKRLGKALTRHLRRHGKAKMYVLSYHPNPKQELRSGIPDPERKGAVVRVADVNAEALRLLIRGAFPERKRAQWFRLKNTDEGKNSTEGLENALKRTEASLEKDVKRIRYLLLGRQEKLEKGKPRPKTTEQVLVEREERRLVRESLDRLEALIADAKRYLAEAESKAAGPKLKVKKAKCERPRKR